MHKHAPKLRGFNRLHAMSIAALTVGLLLVTPPSRAADGPGGSIFNVDRDGKSAGEPSAPRAAGKAVQILKLIDAEATRVNKFKLRDGVLISHDEENAKMTLPYAPAPEYDLAVDFVRTSGNADMALTFPVGRSNCTLSVGGNQSRSAWLGEVDGKWGSTDNPTRAAFAVENDRHYHVVVKVRRDGVKAYVDDKLLCQHQSDGDDLCVHKPFASRSSRLVAVCSYKSVVEFHSVEVTNLGEGGAAAVEKTEDGRPVSPIAVVPGPGGVYDLSAPYASAHGANFNFQRSFHKTEAGDKNPPGLRNFGSWGDARDYLSWVVDVKQAGDFTVALTGSCEPGQEGSEVAVTFDGEAPLPFTVENTGGWRQFRTTDLGTVTLPVGKVTIALKATRKPHSFVMDVEGIKLTPKKGN